MDTKGETKYERLRKIGIGSYGVVFKCVNRQTGQIVAIKRYSENDSDPVIRKIAMREVRMLRQLKHPNLINLIEVFRRKRILHLVFDYCELTVLDVIEKYGNNCPLNLIKKIIWQLVNGVSHCHSRNCIHRDIKPENILINQSGVVKLCDFGFARNLSTQVFSERNSSSSSSGGIIHHHSLGRLAATTPSSAKKQQQQQQQQQQEQQLQYEREAKLLGVVVPSQSSTPQYNIDNNEQQRVTSKENYLLSDRQALTEYVATRWYRAPELLVGDIYYDIKIDIWAIGCVTAELMRGEPLWPGRTDLDQLFMIMSSLGSITPSQAHTLLTQGLYDQENTERLLNQAASAVIGGGGGGGGNSGGHVASSDPLERKLPARVGQQGIDFVLACLRMEPKRRPLSDELLRHTYIQSAQMSQFVKASAEAAAAAAAAAAGQHQASASSAQPAYASPLIKTTRFENNNNNTSSSSNKHTSTPTTTPVHRAIINRSNSQAILRAANQQPASKRLVLAPLDSSASVSTGASSGASTITSTSTSTSTGTGTFNFGAAAAANAGPGAGAGKSKHTRGTPARYSNSLVPVPIRTVTGAARESTLGQSKAIEEEILVVRGPGERMVANHVAGARAHKRKELAHQQQQQQHQPPSWPPQVKVQMATGHSKGQGAIGKKKISTSSNNLSLTTNNANAYGPTGTTNKSSRRKLPQGGTQHASDNMTSQRSRLISSKQADFKYGALPNMVASNGNLTSDELMLARSDRQLAPIFQR